MQSIDIALLTQYLRPRPRQFHKGEAGHVLIVGGNVGYSGAVRLAAEAALRTGAGLVTVATRPEHASTLNVCRPEIMCHGVMSASEMNDLVAKADVIVAGPGLGQVEWSQEVMHALFATKTPMIVDADGLNLLANHPIKKGHWILTPHPGEAARLLHTTRDMVQADRVATIEKLQQQYGGIIVLKGSGTLVLGEESELFKCSAGNPGMATAGMGDVLSGVLGAFVAQGIPLFDAALLGVELHATAGDLAAHEGGERGMIASDVIGYLRGLVNRKES